MSATPEGRKSRDAAYKSVLNKLAALRMQGELDWDMVLDLTREAADRGTRMPVVADRSAGSSVSRIDGWVDG